MLNLSKKELKEMKEAAERFRGVTGTSIWSITPSGTPLDELDRRFYKYG